MTQEKKPPGSGRGGRRSPGARPDPIGTGLRQLWTDVENEPVPDDFLNLLDAIDQQRSQKVAQAAPGRGGGDDGGDTTKGRNA